MQLAGDFATNSTATLPLVGSISGNSATATIPIKAAHLQFIDTVALPVIDQLRKQTDAATQSLTITAQAAFTSAVTNVNGGPLQLAGGAPLSAGVTGLRGATRIRMGGSAIIEAAEPVVGQLVVSLCLLANLSSVNMPAGTGSGVIYISSAVANPTVNASGGGIFYVDALTSALTFRGLSGTTTVLASA